MYSRVLRNLLTVSRKYSGTKINNQFKTKFYSRGKNNFIRSCYSSAAAANSQNVDTPTKPKQPDRTCIDEELLEEEGDSWSLKNKHEKAKDRLEKMLQEPEMLRLYKVLQIEVEVMRQSGDDVPENLKDRDWVELLLMNSQAKRKRYLNFLFCIEKKEENKRNKRLAKSKEVEELRQAGLLRPNDIPLWMQYTLGGNSLFMRIRDSSMNTTSNWWLHRASMFGPKVVLDCGFEDKMTRQEIRNCAKQLMFAFAANREYTEPFDLHFCNLNRSSYLFEELYSFIPTMLEPEFPINLHENSYLDLYPRDKLVYLTPDCKQMMSDYDTDAVYIVGAIVDKVSGNPVTLAKAKKEGIRMAKLPIDKYLNFGGGSNKSLTINQVIGILCDYYNTGDWYHAFRFVPRRKLTESREVQLKKKLSYYLENNKDFKSGKDFAIESRNKFRR
ncbi:mitochondrial ribonuclease P protein 1 homolog [Cotesia glomerata]|uniref:RNA (guanine-9-)-methyltransferase domain-containing protein 1 n=1 Tax=Cotesia glomerata TaxID=32391 RepID=A0AAV7IJF1_COTGL|nr:mitochondrial ribonuclease P protein 1 homolog [Cotesia glomerata]KAH0552586.1 hypothetical protein KQX54_012970 [Cotesia glomerata]